MKIIVIGGTGLIGAKAVDMLRQQGQHAVAGVPSTGVDIVTGRGLKEALEGANVVIDVSNSPALDGTAAMDFFQIAGRNIATAEKAAGVGHRVALSVVGTERLQDSGYFRAKLAQEELIRASPIPHTLVRATQFFEFLRGIADSATDGDTVRLPDARFQPMAARDVAAAIAGAALGAPAHGTVEIAGPEPFRIDELVARVLAHDGDTRRVIPAPGAPYFGVSLDEASLMPGLDVRLSATTFEWWLANVPPPVKR